MSEKIEKQKEAILQISKTTTDVEGLKLNTSCEVNNIFIREDNIIRVHQGVGIIPEIEGKNIKLVFNDGKEVELPEEIQKNLLSYIKNQGKILNVIEGKIDCNSFVSFVYGIGMMDREKIFKITEKKVFSSLNPGDIVFLENKLDFKQGNFHFAIYLGNDLYISKFSNANIGISSLSELENLYNPTNIVALSKKDSKAS